MAEDSSLPITGLCVVEQTCPSGYIMLDKCEDNPKMEADLWKDHLFAKKVKRFLCITRVFPLAQGMLNNVLVDVYIHDEKDPPPGEYSQIISTQDTNEQAFKRKCLSVKLVPRSQASDAITNLTFLSKQKKASPGYTLVGELNGFLLCYKVGKVPTQKIPPPLPPSGTSNYFTTAVPQAMQQSYNPYMNNQVQTVGMQGHPAPMYNTAPATRVQVAPARQQSRVHPLTGVPFEIHSKFTNSNSSRVNFDNFTFKTRAVIMNEFDYQFTAERQAQQTSQHFNGA